MVMAVIVTDPPRYSVVEGAPLSVAIADIPPSETDHTTWSATSDPAKLIEDLERAFDVLREDASELPQCALLPFDAFARLRWIVIVEDFFQPKIDALAWWQFWKRWALRRMKRDALEDDPPSLRGRPST